MSHDCLLAAVASTTRVDANGTMWRLRSLVAMGHDCARIARAIGVPPEQIRRVVHGQARTVTAGLRAAACQLWDAWWDKTPLARTPAERRAAARALRLAENCGWPAAAGLDEEELDLPGYRPWSRYRPALGTGTAPDYPPAPRRQGHRMTASGADRAGAQAAHHLVIALADAGMTADRIETVAKDVIGGRHDQPTSPASERLYAAFDLTAATHVAEAHEFETA